MLVDSHCHLDFDALQADIDGVMQRAREAGVERMVTISTRVKKFDTIKAIAEAYPHVFCSVGTHPHNADEELDISVEQLVELSAYEKCVAIGEAGLDYFYDNAPREAQEIGFRRHIEAARITQLPLVIHTRDAEEDTARILSEETEKGEFPFVLHCFSSGEDLALHGIELGGYVSFSGIATFKSAAAIVETAKKLPLDRILVETDAPYLAPVPHRGKSNEPSFVRHTAEFMANALEQDFEQFAKQTTENFDHLFKKAVK
ncbi:D-aminoacyl-tRNA deacylase [Maritalea myrionectae]|uniref:D-aminoacyl-tRNA deacylase n=1 Tax=Maritalea myrionectae TaxID=454601 RepID=A0A2R4MF96_9HYPH|nr:TatD family hydrolase [Maritalea myrionectae]AVX04643.1 D-aminoacyl-tRNA deacylase [Maritalea myrionectae]